MTSKLFRRDARRRFGIAATTTLILLGGALPAASADPVVPPTGSSTEQDTPPPAEPPPPPPRPTPVARVEPIDDRWLRVFVDSPAMRRTVEVQVLLPRDQSTSRPTVYMLDGRSAKPDSNNWTNRGGAAEFFEDKAVNVVLTVGGPASFYTDWRADDPVLGTNKWETFLTRELPPLLDERFRGDGRNAVMGVSMGAEAAMMLAVRAPALYRSVAAHSGCYSMSTEPGQAQARAIVATYRGDPDNMFGEPDDPQWAAHDVVEHADALRGKALYVSTGSGLPGKFETPDNPDTPNSIAFGGPLEAGAGVCTRRLVDRLDELDIPVTAHFRGTGTHSWLYWAEELGLSWPTVARGLGLT